MGEAARSAWSICLSTWSVPPRFRSSPALTPFVPQSGGERRSIHRRTLLIHICMSRCEYASTPLSTRICRRVTPRRGFAAVPRDGGEVPSLPAVPLQLRAVSPTHEATWCPNRRVYTAFEARDRSRGHGVWDMSAGTQVTGYLGRIGAYTVVRRTACPPWHGEGPPDPYPSS